MASGIYPFYFVITTWLSFIAFFAILAVIITPLYYFGDSLTTAASGLIFIVGVIIASIIANTVNINDFDKKDIFTIAYTIGSRENEPPQSQ